MLDGCCDRAVSRPPAQNQDFASGRAEHLDGRDVLLHALNLFSSQADHEVVIIRFVVDVTRNVLLLDSADAMFESWCTGDRPRARQSLLITQVWEEAFGFGAEVDLHLGQAVERGDLPWLRAVRQIAVRQE